MRHPLRLLLVLGALSAYGPLSVDLYLPGLPKLTADFGASASAGQLTLTACVVGLAAGQLLVGPLSDRYGRRPPLLLGLALYCAVSLACAAAPSVWALTAARLVQGLCGAAGIVVARSVVRDLATGTEAARLFSILMLVLGLAPVLAPILGGQLLQVTSWRGLFVVLAGIDAAILAATAAWLRETHPPEKRRRGGSAADFAGLLRDPVFVAYSSVLALAFATLFAYIAGSSFVLQDVYGVSPQLYGALFGMNAFGIIVCSQAGRVLVGRVPARRLVGAGTLAQAAAGSTLLGVVAVGGVGLPGILPCLFACVAALGLIVPSASALALTDYPHAAGSASALLGALQFGLGGAIAPVIGVAGRHTALPMALVMAVAGTSGLAALLAAGRTAQGAALPASQAAPRA